MGLALHNGVLSHPHTQHKAQEIPPPQSEARTNKEKKSVMAFIRSPFIWYIVCGVVFLFLMLAVTGCIKPPPSSLPLLR
jgi:hypothetical protein